MRRWVCLVLAAFLLTSCSSVSVSPITSGFRCRVETVYDGVAIAAQLDRFDSGKTTLTFSQPPEIDGVIMVYDQEQVWVEFLGMSVDIPAEYLTQSALIRAVADALDAAALAGGIPQGAEIVFDPQNGLPQSLELEDPPALVRFFDWEFAA